MLSRTDALRLAEDKIESAWILKKRPWERFV